MRKPWFLFLLVTFLFAFAVSPAQQLTVREIMAEPSMAGMRPEGEKLSPDGSKVIFLWNAEGKMPADLYLVSTSGNEAPQKILSPSNLPPPSRPPEKENKLDYGLVLRDDFAKARENQLGNFEWSPDSKKLVFSFGGDLYLISLEQEFNSADSAANQSKWAVVESSIERRANLIPLLYDALRRTGIEETDLVFRTADNRSKLLNLINTPRRSSEHRQLIMATNQSLDVLLNQWKELPSTYPQLKQGDIFKGLIEELTRDENQIKAARIDYNSHSNNRIRRITKTQAPETGPRFLDNDRILFQQSGHLFVLDTANTLITQISKESNPQSFISVFNPTPNKAGTLVAYGVSDSSKQKALIVPNYLDEFTAAPSVRRGWSEQKILVTAADGSRDTPFEIKLPKPEGVSSFRRILWAADDRSLIVDRVDKDTKRRQLYYIRNVGAKDEQTILITEETDPKWQAPLSSIVEANPKDPSQLFFGSERDGYNHLYLATLERNVPAAETGSEIAGGNPTDPGYSPNARIEQLTKGNWQVEWAKWNIEADEIIYMSTQGGYTGREFYSIHLPTRETLRVAGTPESGMRGGPQTNLSGPTFLLYEFSTWNRPGDLHAVRVCPRCSSRYAPRKLTDSVPANFAARKWNEPKFIEIPSRDGKKIPAKIYVPAGHNPRSKTRRPMVVFVHGAGYLQNVINGWNNYYREFLFNQLLTQKGYVVLDIDYRGSAGYGRDWRTDVFDYLGGKDMDDHIDAIDHMVANYGVDPKRVGVYGGSYGGFMAGMLAMRAPEKIAAAAALRPVFDWKNYYASSPGYTAQRLGFPDKNPEAYKRSSPITYADKLTRPLLILHGMADDNVHVQDSVQLIEKLIRLGKTQYFEAMLYPVENHGFTRPASWADEYERILGFFEKHLK